MSPVGFRVSSYVETQNTLQEKIVFQVPVSEDDGREGANIDGVYDVDERGTGHADDACTG